MRAPPGSGRARRPGQRTRRIPSTICPSVMAKPRRRKIAAASAASVRFPAWCTPGNADSRASPAGGSVKPAGAPARGRAGSGPGRRSQGLDVVHAHAAVARIEARSHLVRPRLQRRGGAGRAAVGNRGDARAQDPRLSTAMAAAVRPRICAWSMPREVITERIGSTVLVASSRPPETHLQDRDFNSGLRNRAKARTVAASKKESSNLSQIVQSRSRRVKQVRDRPFARRSGSARENRADGARCRAPCARRKARERRRAPRRSSPCRWCRPRGWMQTPLVDRPRPAGTRRTCSRSSLMPRHSSW